jgi:hypothetical protein
MHIASLLFVLVAVAMAGTSTSKKQCSPHVVAAAAGIHLNIIGQEGECRSLLSLPHCNSEN